MHEGYGDESLRRYSSILNKQFDVKHPSWLNTEVQFTELQDESGLLQLGYDETAEYLGYNSKQLLPSAWTDHPSKNSTGLYKFVSMEINLD